MTFDWKSYLDVANDLAKRGDEAGSRSAISRAYYAAFCTVRNWLKENTNGKFEIHDKSESHKVIWEHFNREPNKLKKRIANMGKRLRELRRQADYDDEVQGLKELRDAALSESQTILELISKLKSLG